MINKFKRIISALICGVIVTSTVMTAFAAQDSAANGEGTDGNVTFDPNAGYGTVEPWSDYEQGYRIYMVDSSGQVVSDVRDYWFTKISGINTFAAGGSASKCHLRVGGQEADYSVGYIDELDLGYIFNPKGDEMCTYTLPTVCWHSSTKRNNGKTAFEPFFKDIVTDDAINVTNSYVKPHKIIKDGIEVEVCGAEWVAYTQWRDLYETAWERELSLVVEHVFAVDLGNNHSKFKGKKFYGSVYEWGLFYKSLGAQQSLINISYPYTNKFIPISIVLQRLTNTEVGGIQNTKNILVPTNLTNPSVDEIINYGYGTMIFHKIFEPIIPPVDKKPTEQDDVILNNNGLGNNFETFHDQSTASIDDIEVYFGNRGTDGKYDIGNTMGIPTTEWFTDAIYAQDRIIQYKYNREEYSKEVTANYNITYTYYETITDECPDPEPDGTCNHGGHSHEEERTGTLTTSPVTVTRNAKYYYTKDFAVYGLENVSMINQAGDADYSQDLTDLTEDDILFLCSGEENPSAVRGSVADYHIDFSDVTSQTYTNKFSSEAAARDWYNANRLSWAEENVGYPVVKNDSVIIAGKTYMDETEVSKDESTVIKQEGSEIVSETNAPQPLDPTKDYKITNQEQDVYIDATILNGQYYSTIKVQYEKLVATLENHPYYLTFSWTSTDGDKSHIIHDAVIGADSLTPMTMVGNIDLVNGVSTDYIAQEPIRVITPVISPTTLRYDEEINDETGVQQKVSSSFQGDTTSAEEERLLHGTELITEANVQQLRLDETYVLTFDPAEHFIYSDAGYSGLADAMLLGYGESDTNNNNSTWLGTDEDGKLVFSIDGKFTSQSKYDKYVKEKRIRFPFDVYIDQTLFRAGTWISLYTYDPVSNIATSGDVRENHLYETKFYIPSWATETQLEKITDAAGNVTYVSKDTIEVEVVALNAGVKDANNEYNDGKHDTSNLASMSNPGSGDTYIATYSINVQLSGWLYDFKVLGASPSGAFKGIEYDDTDYLVDKLAPLAEIRDEFFNGIYNRTGHDSIYNSDDVNDSMQRYLIDGTIEEVDDYRDTIPLSSGVSEFSQLGGNLMRGSDFTFSISTMSNLDEDDKITIKPTFTYVSGDISTEVVTDKNGNKTVKIDGEILDSDEIQVYYSGTNENKSAYVSIEETYNDNRNETYGKIDYQFDYPEMEGALNKEDILYMVQKRNLERFDQILHGEASYIGTLREVTLQASDVMLYNTDALEELKVNQGRDSDNLVDILSEKDNYAGGNVSLSNYTDTLTESVQTWYGRYAIPRKLFVVKTADLEAYGVDNLYDYAVLKGSLREDDEIFLNSNNGFLIVNFDITVYKDGEKYMTYRYGTSNQWQRQGQRTMTKIMTMYTLRNWSKLAQESSLSTEDFLKKYPVFDAAETVPIQWGDVAVVEIGPLSDAYANVKAKLVFTN